MLQQAERVNAGSAWARGRGFERISMREFAAGFTLIELLVVIVVISVLLGIVLTIGSRVSNSGRKIQTVATIQQLDRVLEEYMNDREALPPALVPDPTSGERSRQYIPVADGVTTNRSSLGGNRAGAFESVNSVGYFLRSVGDSASARSLIESITPPPSRYSPTPNALEPTNNTGGNGQPQGGVTANPDQAIIPTVFDAFRVQSNDLGPDSDSILAGRTGPEGSNPIRFVHPAFDGVIVRGDDRPQGTSGQFIRVDGAFQGIVPPDDANGSRPYRVEEFRRNFLSDDDRAMWSDPDPALGDSDGGICPGGTPYFYSPGPDGDPSTLDDNVYSTVPQFQPGASRSQRD